MSEGDYNAGAFGAARLRGATCLLAYACLCGAPCMRPRDHAGACSFVHNDQCDRELLIQGGSDE